MTRIPWIVFASPLFPSLFFAPSETSRPQPYPPNFFGCEDRIQLLSEPSMSAGPRNRRRGPIPSLFFSHRNGWQQRRIYGPHLGVEKYLRLPSFSSFSVNLRREGTFPSPLLSLSFFLSSPPLPSGSPFTPFMPTKRGPLFLLLKIPFPPPAYRKERLGGRPSVRGIGFPFSFPRRPIFLGPAANVRRAEPLS